MKIDLVACEGPIAREIPGLVKLKQAMPANWFAYANREIAVGKRKAVEVDLIIVGDDRLFVVDLKDWYGVLESSPSGAWLQNGIPHGRSAVRKIREHAKKLAPYFKSRLSGRAGGIFVEGFVVSTGQLDYSALPEDERLGILTLAEFASLSDPNVRKQLLDDVHRSAHARPLTEFKSEFDLLMRIGSAVKPRTFRPFGFSLGQAPEFVHRTNLYREFSGLSTAGDQGVVRHWDFTVLPIEMQEINTRSELLKREAKVRDHLALHSSYFEADEWALRRLGVDDDLELLELPRALSRATTYIGKAVATVSPLERLDKVKALLATVAEMHKFGCAHTDLGPNSIWLGHGARHKLSNLAAARIPSAETLGPQRFLLANKQTSPADGGDPFQMDLVAVATLGKALLCNADGSHEPHLNPILQVFAQVESRGFSAGAGALLDQVNALDPRAQQGTKAMQELKDRAVCSTNPYVAFPIMGVPRQRGDQLTYASQADGRPVVVKLWSSVSNSSAADRIFSALPAFIKARAIMESSHPAFAPVLAAGIGQGAAFVVLGSIDGDEWTAQLSADQDRLRLCRALVHQVSSSHEAGLAHGDLSPSNIRLAKGTHEASPVFVDFIRVRLGPDDPSDYTPGFSPPAECDDFQRDAYALGKLVIAALSDAPSPSVASSAVALISAELEDGWRDPSLLIAKIKSALQPEVAPPIAATCVQIPVATLVAPSDLESDGGSYYVRYRAPTGNEHGTLFINGLRQSLRLPTDSEGNVSSSHGRLSMLDASTLVRLRMSRPEDIRVTDVSIRLVPLSDVTSLQATAELLKAWCLKAISPRAPYVAKQSPPRGTVARAPATRRAAWQLFAQAESEARLELRITAEATEEANGVTFPVKHWQVPEDRTSPRTVYQLNRNGEEVELGSLLYGQCGPRRVVVEGISLQDLPAAPLPRLVIRDKRNESARDKKVTAAKRLVEDGGARAGLLKEFDALAARDYSANVGGQRARSQLTQEDLKAYALNEDQERAVLGVINGDGLFLLQGPPGTGKTKTIATLVHLIATRLGSRRILVASQTHEAVNNAASKIAETFDALGSTLDLVRVGNEDDVADDLLSVHTAALRRDFISLFVAESDARLRPVGKEIGLSDEVIDALFDIHRAVAEPLERAVSWERGAVSEHVRVRPAELRLVAQAALAQRFPGAAISETELAAARVRLATLVSTKHGTASPDQCHRFLNVISASGDTLRRLSGGASDGAFGEFLVKTRAIACGTCVGIGSAAFKLADKVFDWAIVDEAGRCTSTELAVAVQSARRVVLVGDHLQLPPFIGPELKAALVRLLDADDVSEWSKSDFEHMFDDSLQGRRNCASLWDQYRMIEPISRIVSDLAYDEKLKCKRQASIAWAADIPWVGQTAVTFVDTSCYGPSESRRKPDSTSFQNEKEADWIVGWLKAVLAAPDLCEALRKATIQDDQAAVGIICAYADQVDLVKERIYDEGMEDVCNSFVKVGTVDSYQGRENVVVLVSLVRSNPVHDVGHVNLFQRVNVALSRAKDRLVVIGDSSTWLDPINAGYLAGQAWRYVHERTHLPDYRIVAANSEVSA